MPNLPVSGQTLVRPTFLPKRAGAFGRRCVKLDAKGFSREKDDWADIGEGDLPWDDVRKALDEVGFSGWAAAEVKGGDVDRLTTVCQQMRKAFGA